jgi:hypothetical protein
VARLLLNTYAHTEWRINSAGEPDTDTGQTIFRKDVRDALVREALKDEAFREPLLANPKFAVERALGTTLPDRLEVVLLREGKT